MADEHPAQFWFRVPDDEPMLMGLKPAQLRAYLIVIRDIQRARNGGLVSARQIRDRSGLSLQHSHAALEDLVRLGHLRVKKKRGGVSRYGLPFAWQRRDCSPTGEHQEGNDCSPVGEHLTEPGEQLGEHHCSPTGERKCSPTGEQPLESLESSELKSEEPSSSSQDSGLINSAASAKQRPTEEEEASLSSKPKTKTPDRHWWKPEDLETAAGILKRTHGEFSMFKNPDPPTVIAMLRNMLSLDDLKLWLDSSSTLLRTRKDWGGFVADSRHWPTRRETVHALVDEFKPEPESKPLEVCKHGIARVTCMDCSAPAPPPSPPKPKCIDCGGSGIIDPGTLDLIRWCTCEAGAHRKTKEPKYVETHNGYRERLAHNFAERAAGRTQ